MRHHHILARVTVIKNSTRVLLTTAKDRPSNHLLQSKEACPHGRQYQGSTESEISTVFLHTGFWNSSKGPFILGEIPLGRLDLGWSLGRDQELSFWSGSTESKTLHLISIIKDDLEDIKLVERGLNETIHIRGGVFS